MEGGVGWEGGREGEEGRNKGMGVMGERVRHRTTEGGRDGGS